MPIIKLYARDGQIVHSEIHGEIKMESKIQNFVDINVFLTLPVALKDFSIHPCLQNRQLFLSIYHIYFLLVLTVLKENMLSLLEHHKEVLNYSTISNTL